MSHREEVARKIAPLAAPIEGTNAAGADISYDPDFETVKAEIDKLSSVDNIEPSWGRIHSVGSALLTRKAKDLRIASWMGVALVKTQGFEGFAESLVLYEALCRTFWDTMFPEVRRSRARVNAFAWMADMVNQHLVGKEVTLADADAIRTGDEVLKDLDQFLAEKLGDAYPGPGQLRSLMRDKLLAIPEPAAADEPPPPPSVAAPLSIRPRAPVAPPPPRGVEDVEASVRAGARVLTESAAVVRTADPSRAWAYKLQRWGAWMPIEELPPAKNGQTFIPAPAEDAAKRLTELRDGQKWHELLNVAEEMTGTYLFWMDLHRYVALALDCLGPTFLAARETVGREVTFFVARMPSVVSLSFRGGTPFADSATKAWLDEEAKKYGGGGGPSVATAVASAEDEEIARRLVEAQKLVTEGKVADGLASALALADRSPDARLRFRARLLVGKMALDSSKPELARGMLEHLLVDVERHGLETWEPATCATLYSYLLVVARETSRGKGASPDLQAKEQYLFDKLCRLDPASAIRLST